MYYSGQTQNKNYKGMYASQPGFKPWGFITQALPHNAYFIWAWPPAHPVPEALPHPVHSPPGLWKSIFCSHQAVTMMG
jgi:hypothetical protein